MNEEAVSFISSGSLVGVITSPNQADAEPRKPAVLLLNSGFIHRVGPNRLYVKIARDLAGLGFTVLRFDFSGVGDSQFRKDKLLPAEGWIADTTEAMNFLREQYGFDRFILMGICGGGYFAFETARHDDRVIGLALVNVNGHLHDAQNEPLDTQLQELTVASHNRRIGFGSSFVRKKWSKLLKGEVNVWAVVENQLKGILTRKDWENDQGSRIPDLIKMTERGVKLFHVYSEGDIGLDYINLMLGKKLGEWLSSGRIEAATIRGANHTFTVLDDQKRLLKIIHDRFDRLPG